MNKQTETPEQENKLNEIANLQRQCDAAENDYETSKAETSALKKVLETKVMNLRKYIRDFDKPTPLFETWREVPISELGLPEAVVTFLGESGISKVGELADYTNSGKKLTDLQHIGEAKAEAIEKALEKFWEKRKEQGLDDKDESNDGDGEQK